VLESPDMADRTENAPQLILASNSPRRRELFALCGLEFQTLEARVDETPLANEDGMEYVARLANEKAAVASRRVGVHSIVIAADTTVVDTDANGNRMILGKPENPDEAENMLRGLRGHTHLVHTALSIYRGQDGRIASDICTTHVPMRNYSDQEIQAYIASGDPMDKAGAYAIQHADFHPVEDLTGCYANVMGLPLCHLTRHLVRMALPPHTNVPVECQHALGYRCTVYPQILEGNDLDYTWG